MKRWIAIGAVLLIVVVAAAWSIFVFNSREKYEKAYAQTKSLNLVEIDAESQKLLDDVRANWRNQSGSFEGDGPIMNEFGLAPTVENWAQVQTWKMPAFSYWNSNANLRNAKLFTLQATLLVLSEDGNLYVTKDRTLAYVRVQPGVVYLFENDPAGLRQSIYVRSQQ